jgi:hypothetical protein
MEAYGKYVVPEDFWCLIVILDGSLKMDLLSGTSADKNSKSTSWIDSSNSYGDLVHVHC